LLYSPRGGEKKNTHERTTGKIHLKDKKKNRGWKTKAVLGS